MSGNSIGYGINPNFIYGFNQLKNAKFQLDAAKKVGGETLTNAENRFHAAEAYFCNQKGLSDDGGNMSEKHALAVVDSYMNQVAGWYA